jgi:hypothetical protein
MKNIISNKFILERNYQDGHQSVNGKIIALDER